MSTRRWLILGVAIAAVLAAYTAAGFLGVPRLVRSQLLSFIDEHYHRQASIGEIRFNPYTFALEAHDFSMPDADGQRLLGFGRLLVDLDAATIWRRAPSFGAIEIDSPFARVLIRADGSLNLADLSQPFASSAPPPAEKSAPTRLFIDRFRVGAGDVQLEDHTRPSPFRAELRPITFELRDFSTTGKTGNAYTLTGASAAGERFAWDGTFAVQPLASRGHFKVEELQARTLWSYLRDALGFEFSSGRIGLTGDYDFAAGKAVELKINVNTIGVADLGIRPKGQDADYVQLADLQIEQTRFDLASQRVDIGKISLNGGTVRAWRETDGSINLLALTQAPAPASPASASSRPAIEGSSPQSAQQPATPPPVPAQKNSSALVLAAPNIAVHGLKVELEDRFVKPTASFTLTPVDVTIAGFSTANNASLQIEAKAGINETGQLSARARVAPGTGAVSGHIDLNSFELASLQPYLNTYTQMTLQSGVLKTGLDLERTANGALTLKGDTEVSKLRTVDNALRQDFIKWDHLQLQGIDYASDPAHLRIASIATRTPYARLIIAPDQTINVSKILSPEPGNMPAAVQTVRTKSGETTAPAGNPGAMPISIGTVKIANGSANFADFWIQPNYAVSVQGMDGTIVGLSSDPSSRARVKLEGKVDRYAPAQIGGEINLLSAALFTDMKVSFKGVEMTSVTPYSGRFAGYKIEKGKLSIDVAYHVQNRKLEAKQHFVIDQLQLGERVESPDAVRLPLRLAIALLKDRNGVIDVDLPVSGSLDDPTFRLAPIIWKAVINLLGKIATAPFALLGRLFGGSEDMNLVDFEAGAATLDAAAQERMTALIKALKERPQLQLEVPMTYSPDVDRPVLEARKLEQRLLSLAQQNSTGRKRGTANADATVPVEPAPRFDLLLAQYRIDLGADAPLPPAAAEAVANRKKKSESPAFDAANSELTGAIVAKQPVTERELEELAQARAHAIQDALLSSGEVDAGRVFLLGASAKPATENKVRLELSLK